MPQRAPSIDRQLALLRIYGLFTFPFAGVPFLWFHFAECGIDLEAYTQLIAVYYVTMVVVEVPTGYLADRFGRILPAILGPLLLAVGFGVFALGSSFEVFCVAQVLVGFGHSILSGPPAALLFETLQSAGRAPEYLREESRIHGIRLAGTGVAFLLGGVVAHFWGFRASIVATAPLCVVGSVIAMFLRRPTPVATDTGSPVAVNPADSEPSQAPARATTKRPDVLRGALRDLRLPAVRWLVAYYVILFCLLRFPFHYYQPYLSDRGLDTPLLIGGLYFLLNVVASPCSRLAPRITERFGERAIFATLPLILGASVLAMSYLPLWAGVTLFFLQQVPFGMHWAMIQNFANQRVQDASRATVLSTLSLCGRLGFSAALPLIMLAAPTVNGIYTLAGIGGCVATGLVLVWGSKYLGRRATRA